MQQLSTHAIVHRKDTEGPSVVYQAHLDLSKLLVGHPHVEDLIGGLPNILTGTTVGPAAAPGGCI